LVRKVPFKALLIGAGCFLLIEVGLYLWGYRHSPLEHSSDATSFAYDNLNSGTATTDLTLAEFSSATFTSIENRSLSKAHKFQPLYVDFRRHPQLETRFPTLRGKRVLFYSSFYRGSSIVALDLSDNQILWHQRILGPVVSTGAISLRHGKIYFLSHLWEDWNRIDLRHVFGHKQQFYNRKTYQLESFDLDGTAPHPVNFELGALNPHEVVLRGMNVSDYVMKCATSLAIHDDGSRPYVALGCSGGAEYRVFKGVRGVLIKVPLDEEGLLQEDKISTFYPSKVTPDSDTGFDTGIYLGGSDVSVLPGGKILVGTANGPSMPAQENYACSILRLAEDLSVDGRGARYAREPEGYAECFGFNLDIAAGITVTRDHEGQLLAAAKGKDGVVHVFDPNDMSDANTNRKAEYDVGDLTYGSPLIFTSKDRPPRIIASGYNKKFFPRHHDALVFATERDQQQLASLGFVKKACIGYEPSDGPGTKQTAFYYSGHVRSNLIQLPPTAALAHDIVDRRNKTLATKFNAMNAGLPYWPWSPYKKIDLSIKTLGPSQPLPPGMARLRIDTYYSDNQFYHYVPGVSDPEIKKGLHLTDATLNILTSRGGDPCERKVGFQNLYSYQLPKDVPEEPRYSVSALDLLEGKLAQAWKLDLPVDFEVQRSNLLLIKTKDGHGIVAVPIIYVGQKRITNMSKILFVRADNGDIIHSIPVDNSMHFSHPLLLGDKFVAATRTSLNVYHMAIDQLRHGINNTLTARALAFFKHSPRRKAAR
jgi:hypothetical protein